MCGCSCWRYFKAAQSKGWHLPWWTMVFSVASIAVFMYMAGWCLLENIKQPVLL